MHPVCAALVFDMTNCARTQRQHPCSHHQALGNDSEWQQYVEVRRYAAALARGKGPAEEEEEEDEEDEGEQEQEEDDESDWDCQVGSRAVVKFARRVLDGFGALTDEVGAWGCRACGRGAGAQQQAAGG